MEKSNGQQQQHNVVENPQQQQASPVVNDDKRHDHSFLAPFVLGFAIALILILVPLVSGIYWSCKDVELNNPTTTTTVQCPRIISFPPENESGSGPLGFLTKKKKNRIDSDNIVLELPPPPDPKECSCRLLLSTWDTLFSFSNNDDTEKGGGSNAPLTCTPQMKSDSISTTSEEESKPDPELQQRYKSAFTSERLIITPKQKSLIEDLYTKVEEYIPNFKERASNVRWGAGSITQSSSTGYDWFALPNKKISNPSDSDKLPGGRLFYSYLRIMKWPNDLRTTFPFKLCSKGCNAQEAIRHTLEFREKFKPWLITQAVKDENSKGSIFVHGFSHPDPNSSSSNENGAHSLVWVRPGRRTKVDDYAYTRAYINTIEKAVAASMIQSNGRIGKFNSIVDGSNFSWGVFPSRHQLFAFVLMLQDHFPDRLGMLWLTNLGRVGELVAKLILPLLSEEVRQKIHVLPNDPIKRRKALEAVMPTKYIPDWLGGSDTFVFDHNKYYADSIVISDEEAKEFITTMPYHS